MLRGVPVMPVVKLSARPMKTKFGIKTRPHFDIIGWETPGDIGALPAKPTPQAIAPPTPEPKSPEAPRAADRPPGKITMLKAAEAGGERRHGHERRQADTIDRTSTIPFHG